MNISVKTLKIFLSIDEVKVSLYFVYMYNKQVGV